MLKTLRPLLSSTITITMLQDGWTASMYACDKGNFELVEVLLSKGADPNEAAQV